MHGEEESSFSSLLFRVLRTSVVLLTLFDQLFRFGAEAAEIFILGIVLLHPLDGLVERAAGLLPWKVAGVVVSTWSFTTVVAGSFSQRPVSLATDSPPRRR